MHCKKSRTTAGAYYIIYLIQNNNIYENIFSVNIIIIFPDRY